MARYGQSPRAAFGPRGDQTGMQNQHPPAHCANRRIAFGWVARAARTHAFGSVERFLLLRWRGK